MRVWSFDFSFELHLRSVMHLNKRNQGTTFLLVCILLPAKRLANPSPAACMLAGGISPPLDLPSSGSLTIRK